MGLLGIEGIEQEAVLGRGAFGVVYRAWQPALQRPVAVKVLSGAFDPPALRRFERECGTVGSLSGEPGIVTVYAAGRTSDGSPFLVMPYLRGGSLADRLRDGPLPPVQVVSLGIAVGRALAAAHRHGVLHLDVKPANVLLDGQGRPHLADFGIARFVDAEQRGHTATVAGTPGFAAPEIFDGRKPTIRSDVYGLGATLHALAGGRTPFTLSEAGGLSGLLQQIAHQDPPDLRPSGVPDDLCRVIERAMAKDPEDRYASMDDLVEALEALPSALVSSPPTMAMSPITSRLARSHDVDDPGTLDEYQLPGVPPPPGVPPEVPAAAEDHTIVADVLPPVERSSPSGQSGNELAAPPGLDRERRRDSPASPPWFRLVAALVAAAAIAAAVILLAGRNGGGGDEPLVEDPAEADVELAEDQELLQWLSTVRSINRQLLLAEGDFAQICRDGLERLEQQFGGVDAVASRLIPTGLSDAVSAQSEPGRSLWVELVDATTTRFRDCAAEDLSAERDAELRARIDEARDGLNELLSEQAATSEG